MCFYLWCIFAVPIISPILKTGGQKEHGEENASFIKRSQLDWWPVFFTYCFLCVCGMAFFATVEPFMNCGGTLPRHSWVFPIVILCFLGFFSIMTPSELFFVLYRTGSDKNISLSVDFSLVRTNVSTSYNLKYEQMGCNNLM